MLVWKRVYVIIFISNSFFLVMKKVIVLGIVVFVVFVFLCDFFEGVGDFFYILD